MKLSSAVVPVIASLWLAAAIQGAIAQAPGMPPPPTPPSAAPAAPANFPPPPVSGGPPGVAATVNGQAITKTQLSQTALNLAGATALKQLIANTLVEQQAKALGITVTPVELDNRLTSLKQQVAATNPGGMDAFLKQNNTTLADVEADLRVSLLAEKLAMRGKPKPHMVHVNYIVILTTNPTGDSTIKPHTDAEALALIAKAQADLKSGESFKDVVAKYSEDSGKNNGGDLPIISSASAGQLDPTFVAAALALKYGEVTPTPVHSASFGYFLLKCVSTSEDPINIETKKDESALYEPVEQQMAEQAAQTYLLSVLKTAKIVNYYMPQ